jgi:hypothetical protein
VAFFIKQKMEFLEKNLEDIIFKTSSNDLRKRGLYVRGKRFRQLRIGNYGIADMVTINKGYLEDTHYTIPVINITVYEFKKNLIDTDTLLQASRYINGIKRYFYKHEKFINKEINFKIVLVGKTISKSDDFTFLSDFIKDLQVYTYDYNFDGIKFTERSGWFLTEEGF